jgi:hypothetical protein
MLAPLQVDQSTIGALAATSTEALPLLTSYNVLKAVGNANVLARFFLGGRSQNTLA